jgi:RNA polymerase sigma factor (sigma-70 family)
MVGLVESEVSPRLTEAARDLAARYVPLARALARPRMRRFPSARQEFESAALLGLVMAARNFDPARGVRFSTYARSWILGEMGAVSRELGLSRRDREAEFARPIAVRPLHPEHRGRVLTALPEPPVGHRAELAEEAGRCLRWVNGPHARVCRGIYLEGKSRREMGRQLGKSQTRITELHDEAIAMIRRGVTPARSGGPGWN